MTTVVLIVCLILSFLLGGVPFGLIVGKIMANEDIRTEGSGNIGTTNALRVLGPLAGALTLLFDCLKGIIAVCLSRAALTWVLGNGGADLLAPGGEHDLYLALVAFAAVAGHMYSPYLGFKGGKGIAVGFGVCVAWVWPVGLSLWIPFLIGVVLTRYVSVGSIAAAASLPVWVLVYYPQATPGFIGVFALLAVLVIWAHRSNIVKLAHHKESKLSFSKSKKKQ